MSKSLQCVNENLLLDSKPWGNLFIFFVSFYKLFPCMELRSLKYWEKHRRGAEMVSFLMRVKRKLGFFSIERLEERTNSRSGLPQTG
jgi:hypothetical protein